MSKKVEVGEAAAIFAFGAWLTCREKEAGPFSSRHNAAQMAELCGDFCDSQGWKIDDEYWFKKLNTYPDK